MKINHFFKQPSYHVGDQIESVIALENGEQEQVLTQVTVSFVVRYFMQGEAQTYLVKKHHFPETLLKPHQHKHLSFSCKLAKNLLVSSEQANYQMNTEIKTIHDDEYTDTAQIPILPPKSITFLFTALKQLGLKKQSITFDDHIQIFRFIPTHKKQSIRAYEFAVVFTDHGVRLLLSYDIEHAIIRREAYLSDRWFTDFQQLTAILRHIINPVGIQQKSTIKAHDYHKWTQAATVLGSCFAKFDDLSADDSDDKPPLRDLDDLLKEIFDEDEDED